MKMSRKAGNVGVGFPAPFSDRGLCPHPHLVREEGETAGAVSRT